MSAPDRIELERVTEPCPDCGTYEGGKGWVGDSHSGAPWEPCATCWPHDDRGEVEPRSPGWVPEPRTVGWRVVCATCDNTGKRFVDVKVRDGGLRHEITCPVCGGFSTRTDARIVFGLDAEESFSRGVGPVFPMGDTDD